MIDDIDPLIRQVYDAALDDTLWPGVAPAVALSFETHSAVIAAVPSSGAGFLSYTQNISPARQAEYNAYFHARDVWAAVAKKHLSRVVTSEEIISDAEFERTEIWADWCSKVGMFHLVGGAVLPIGDGSTCIFGVHRERGRGGALEGDKRRLVIFLPHLRRALQLRGEFVGAGIERQAALDALARTRTATLVVTRDGRILYATPQVEQLLRQGDAIRAAAGHLATTDRATTERLTHLISGAADTAAGLVGSPGGAIAIPRDGRLPLTMLVAPFPPAKDGFGAPLPAAILFIRDPEAPSPAKSALRSLFGFSPAEASIAAALADGGTIDAVAASHKISLNTARTHLKAIFAKTGTHRQAQLVAVLLRSVAAMTTEPPAL